MGGLIVLKRRCRDKRERKRDTDWSHRVMSTMNKVWRFLMRFRSRVRNANAVEIPVCFSVELQVNGGEKTRLYTKRVTQCISRLHLHLWSFECLPQVSLAQLILIVIRRVTPPNLSPFSRFFSLWFIHHWFSITWFVSCVSASCLVLLSRHDMSLLWFGFYPCIALFFHSRVC